NPLFDEVLRIMVTDNHALPAAEFDFLGLPDESFASKTRSSPPRTKPTSYTSNNWLRDIKPLVPFRIVVRRRRGDTPVDLDSAAFPVSVDLEIKDPREELRQNDGLRRVFLEGFIANRKALALSAPQPGDDNGRVKDGGIGQPTQALAASDCVKVP